MVWVCLVLMHLSYVLPSLVLKKGQLNADLKWHILLQIEYSRRHIYLLQGALLIGQGLNPAFQTQLMFHVSSLGRAS